MASKEGRAARTATEALVILWEDRFFVSWKKMEPIEETLAKRGNHFTPGDLGMALKRAKHLTRRGKRGQYEYIQKFPFEIAEQPKATAKGKSNVRSK